MKFFTVIFLLVALCLLSTYITFRITTTTSIHYTTTPLLNTRHAHTTDPPPSSSCPAPARVFCFLHAVPKSGEIPLVKLHLERGIGQCDGYAIYSNTTNQELLGTSQVIPGGRAYEFNARSRVEDGAKTQYKTAANTPQLMSTWSTLLNSDIWRSYDWTVKVDADTVLDISSLRCLLGGVSKVEVGKSWGGMAGGEEVPKFMARPEKNSVGGGTVVGQIEALDRRSMELFRSRFLQCSSTSFFHNLLAQNEYLPMSTEDGWFEQCMYVLGSTKVVSRWLMKDVRGQPYKKLKHKGCQKNQWASYYTLKEEEEWNACMDAIEM
ncbi:hypothetical protein TrVE_jg2389 [Triparma verrucosa]|uniref:Uncharacterized protein n=2 Tax=Triparma TaxID=722752 RepID=A0A9W7C053_9STRA|nr:hypothetical protein TrVE_jg2389 [Triparma verrucosa]GMI00767.1 hypothetical protein TrST_g5021 [Triparma strigata]